MLFDSVVWNKSKICFAWAHLDDIMITNKDIHGLDVAVNDLGVVQGLQPFTDLHEVFPDDLLWESLFQLIPLLYKSAQVAVWCILHDNAQQIACKTMCKPSIPMCQSCWHTARPIKHCQVEAWRTI